MKQRALAFTLTLALMLLPFKGLCESALREAPPRSITVLLLGADGTGDKRSAAAIVIAALNLDTGAVKMASIDRNTRAAGPDGSDIRLDATIALGGTALALQTVSDLFKLKITRFVCVDLSGMEKIIDALGGVDVDVRESEIHILLADGKTKAFQKAGLQTLGGAQALAYMKDHTGEEAGGSHMSRVLGACMQKGLKMGFDSLIELVSELMAHVETNMTMIDMMEAVLSALSVSMTGMEAKQFPVYRAEEANDNETAVLIVDSTAEAEALYAFLYGEAARP